ncbi:MAG: hypothetical protein JJU36_04605 [Phycisphaeraceae bacterium]|nr:hypothetical protein [Phycisphaeraceae bacterium]
MPSLRYLNTILTILAVLLTINLWTLWTHPGGLSGSLEANRALDLATPAYAQPGVQPAEQRAKQIQIMEKISTQIEQQNELLRTGAARIRIENVEEIRGQDKPAEQPRR